jgi:hypothetical protein
MSLPAHVRRRSRRSPSVPGHLPTGDGHSLELREESFAIALREARQHPSLERRGHALGPAKLPPASRCQGKVVHPAVFCMDPSSDPTPRLHAPQQRGNRVGIAAHLLGEAALRKLGWLLFVQGAQDGELVGCDSGLCRHASERLVETVPSPAQQRGQPATLGGIHRQASIRRAADWPRTTDRPVRIEERSRASRSLHRPRLAVTTSVSDSGC